MTRIVVLFAGLGDHVLWLSLLEPYRKKIGHVTAVCAAPMADLARLFPTSYDQLMELPLTEEFIQSLQTQGKVSQGDPFLAWHPRFIGDETVYLQQRGKGAIGDVVRDVLGLPETAQMAAPVWSKEAVERALERITAHGLPVGRTVLIAPSSHSLPQLHDMWWSDAVSWLTKNGLTVAMNVANRSRGFDRSRHDAVLEPYPGTVPVDIPLSEIGPFAELCGHTLCARAGLADLLARTTTNLSVVWPRPTEPREAAVRRAWSIRDVYNPAVIEVEVGQDEAFDSPLLEGWLRHER